MQGSRLRLGLASASLVDVLSHCVGQTGFTDAGAPEFEPECLSNMWIPSIELNCDLVGGEESSPHNSRAAVWWNIATVSMTRSSSW